MANLILGLNGAGKGTIAKFLQERQSFEHVCSGESTRAAPNSASKPTPTGAKESTFPTTS